MLRHARRWLVAVGCAVLIYGALNGASASAQTVPPLVGIAPAVGSCALLADLSTCIDAAIPVSPVITGGVVGLGPLAGSGGRNVDVDRDVDHSRQRGSVVIR